MALFPRLSALYLFSFPPLYLSPLSLGVRFSTRRRAISLPLPTTRTRREWSKIEFVGRGTNESIHSALHRKEKNGKLKDLNSISRKDIISPTTASAPSRVHQLQGPGSEDWTRKEDPVHDSSKCSTFSLPSPLPPTPRARSYVKINVLDGRYHPNSLRF